MDHTDAAPDRHEAAIQMITGHGFCVLSTCSHDQPNTSLMQYIASPDGRRIYMLTARDSTKHGNIMANPRVSLLIDTRTDWVDGRSPIRALTVYGTARMLGESAEARQYRQRLADRYPDLAALAARTDGEVILVEAERLLLLDGVDHASRMDI